MPKNGFNSVMIMGAGAVGGFVGAKIFRNKSAETVLVARGNHLKQLQNNGLRFITPDDDEYLHINAVEDPSDAEMMPDLIIMAVKSKDTAGALKQIKPVIGEQTQVLTIQNGLGNYETLRDVLGADRVIRGFCKLGCEVTAPGEITYRSLGDVTIGEDDGTDSPRCTAVKQLLDHSGITCTIPDDILKQAWQKMIWNTVFNCLSGLTATTLDAIYQEPAAYNLAHELARELQKIALSEGVEFRDDEIMELIEKNRKLGAFKTSTYQDRLKNKPLEYDAFCGYASLKAAEAGVSTPKLDTVNALFRLSKHSRI